jgi:tripartite-type tricarboxylate transporter receptor subunit TctC
MAAGGPPAREQRAIDASARREATMQLVTLLSAISMLCWSWPAWTQAYPGRVVRIVVPFAAGAPDSVARILAQQLQAQLGQSVIVENRPAANGTVGTEAVAKAPPDGHTLLVSSSAFAVNPSIYRKLPYDVLADFEAVTMICRSDGYVLAANPTLPAKSVQQLVALARAPESKLSYGSAGVGNTRSGSLRWRRRRRSSRPSLPGRCGCMPSW